MENYETFPGVDVFPVDCANSETFCPGVTDFSIEYAKLQVFPKFKDYINWILNSSVP